MGDWGRDCESARWLAADRVRQLMSKDPNHQLLRFKCFVFYEPDPASSLPEDMIEATMEEYFDYFWLLEKPWQEVKLEVLVVTVATSNYWMALGEALGLKVQWPSSSRNSRPFMAAQ